jgi:hypothetical protein
MGSVTDTLLTFSDPNLVPSRLAEVPVCDFSILALNGGWPEDLERFAAPLPLQRHAHREWEALGDHERERKSRDNFARVLRSRRDRTDLLTGRSGAR